MWVATAAGSWIGERAANEDRVYSDGTSVALFDGIGGRAFGDLAASIALAEVVRRIATDRLIGYDIADILRSADAAVCAFGANAGVYIGTTAVVALLQSVDGGIRTHLGWAGDSSALLLRGDQIAVLTAPQESRQSLGLTSWLGSGDHLPPRHSILTLLADDTLILLSDGVTDVLGPAEIGGVLTTTSSPRQGVDAILDAARAHSATDNCSVVIADFRSSIGPYTDQQLFAGPPERWAAVAEMKPSSAPVPGRQQEIHVVSEPTVRDAPTT